MKRELLWGGLGVIVLVIVGAGIYAFTYHSPTSSALGAAAITSNNGLKPALQGLVSMGDISFRNVDGVPNNSLTDIYARPGIFGGVVINVSWAQVEPAPGKLDTSQIDRALADVRTYNAKYPTAPLGVLLRVSGANAAPNWVKSLGGAPLTINHRGSPETIGRFWSTQYQDAWTELQKMLAAKYDSEPLIYEVANASCSSQTDEPFVEGLDKADMQVLHTAGFSDAAFENCLMGSLNQYGGWSKTRIEFPFSPFHLTDAQNVSPDVAFTIQVMEAWRKQLGARAVIGNHALQGPVPSDLQPIYDEIKKLGPVVDLQLASPNKENVDTSIKAGVSSGATSIEVWDSSCRNCQFTTFSTATLQEWTNEIKQGHL